MNRMKFIEKTGAALLAALLLLSAVCLLGACGGGSGADTSSAPDSSAPVPDTSEPEQSATGTEAEVTTAASDTAPDPYDTTTREGWALEGIPAYQTGKLDPTKYSCGQGLTESAPTSWMQIVTGTTESEYRAYVAALTRAGYQPEYENVTDKNVFTLLYDGTHRVYCYYLNALKQVSVIEDTSSVSLNDFCYTLTPATTTDTVMYAYGFNSTGQILLVHNSDGSWFINDGCTTSLDGEALWQFMREKTVLAEGEKLRISLWYVTHGHADHFPGVASMIEKHHDQISLERCMWNFPDKSVIAPGSDSRKAQLAMQTMVKKYYPNVLYLKQHNGMSVTVGDVNLFFFFAHEDNVPKFLSKEYTDYNSSSSVCMLTFSGVKMFLPGDCKQATLDGDGFICRIYSDATLSCRMMQLSHHGYNKMKTLHQKFYPTLEYVIYMNTYAESVGKDSGSSQAVFNKVGDGCCFSDKSYSFTVTDGKIVRTKLP